MSPTSIRLAAVAVATVPALLTTAVPAQAGDSYLSRTTGFVGVTDWVQYFDFDNPTFGNVHVGSLQAFETSPGVADVFAYIVDFECPPGVYPDPDQHGSPNGCVYTGARQMEGQAVTFTSSRKGDTATLSGTLRASTPGDPHNPDGGGTNLGSVPVETTWTAVGDPVRSSSTYRFRGGGTVYSETHRTVAREATMSGRLGPMLFEQAYQASGSLERFTSTSRSRSR